MDCLMSLLCDRKGKTTSVLITVAFWHMCAQTSRFVFVEGQEEFALSSLFYLRNEEREAK